MNNNIWKIFASAWLGTAIAIIYGLYYTHSAWCLWAFVLPACLNYKSDNKED